MVIALLEFPTPAVAVEKLITPPEALVEEPCTVQYLTVLNAAVFINVMVEAVAPAFVFEMVRSVEDPVLFTLPSTIRLFAPFNVIRDAFRFPAIVNPLPVG